MNRSQKQHLSRIRVLAILFVLVVFCSFNKAKATHLYGADLYYTHNSGLTYTITLVAYGDCAGGAFSSFPTSSATVQVFRGSTFYTSLTLTLQNPKTGEEVTPVCPSQINNTACNGGSLPGVKRFIYTRQITLNTAASDWRFRFTGGMGSTSAGRSNSITNITGAASIMTLEATLNNSTVTNSSATYTTVPTPFFPINKTANYNHGTVDPEGDSLSFSLVPGLTQTGTVSYATGYSATAPLAAATGTFNFNTNTGQLSFTPNMVQQSLVVTQVSEYRNGVLVGTSMREMTFVVLNTNNNPPGGKITNNNRGTVFNNGTSLEGCKSGGIVTFSINPTDQDNDTINVSYSGLPTGAVFTVTDNDTKAPKGSFVWNVTGVTAGSYNFFVTYTDQGCPLSSKQTIAYTIVVLPEPEVSVKIDTPATCARKAVFTMTPSTSGGPWRLQVMQGTSTVHNFTAVTTAQKDSLAPGNYTLRVKNTDSCYKDVPLIIDAPPEIDLDVDVTPLVCHDDSDAVVVVIASGGKKPFTYAKGSAAFSNVDTFKNLWAGYYTFKVRDSNDCQEDTVIRIFNPLPVSADVTIQEPPCNFFNSGVITINGKNGTAPYKYAFNNAPYDTVTVRSGLYSGSYPVLVKDTNNCLLDTTVILPDSVRVSATAALTNILCNSDSTGQIVLNASGANPPYRYQMLTGNGPLTPVNTFSNLPAITYSFHIEDTNKCYLDTMITLTEPARITGSISITDVLCNGDTTGAITINGIGGVSPYVYALDAGTFGVTNTYNPLTAGNYTLRIRDDNNCLRDTTVAITEPTKLVFDDLIISNPECFGAASGRVVTKGAGGVAPYQYAVGTSTFSPVDTFGGLAAGVVTFQVRDTNNCISDSSVTLTQPPRIVPDVAIKESSCSPLDDGIAVITATGGVPGYTYAIGFNSYSASQTFSPLSAGAYTLHVKDDNNCVVDTNINIIDSLDVVANVSINDAHCYDSSSGIINISPGGGAVPYTYSLAGGNFVPVSAFGGLKANTYNLKVKDDLGCLLDTTITINEPTRIVPSLITSDPTCYKYNDGSIIASATGGTPGYEYSFNGGQFSFIPNNLSLVAGSHTVRVKDVNNCIIDTTITLTQPTGIFFQLSPKNLTCNGDSSGSVKIDGTGGTPPYTYTFNNNPYVSSDVLTGISAGRNTIKMKDDNGCVIDTDIVFTEPAKLYLVNPVITSPTCEGYADGTVKIYGNGGIRPYLFAVNSSDYSANNNFENLKEGPHTLRIKDSNNCYYDTTLILQGYPHIVYDEVLGEDVSCFEGADGKITLTMSGGRKPFRYQINEGPEQTDNIFGDLTPGEYIIRVTDDYSCIKDSTVIISEPEKLIVKTTTTPNECEGTDKIGGVTATATGGAGSYSYTWQTQPPQEGATLTGMSNGTYTVVVNDANGCMAAAQGEVVYNNCCIVFVPNAFTPNNDGLNDKIRMRVKGDFELETFSIFNRFGQRVFETNDMSRGWDGTFNSEEQDLGTYNYMIKGVCGNAGVEEVLYKGTITLLK